MLVDVPEQRVAALLVRRVGLLRRRYLVPLASVAKWSSQGPVLAYDRIPTRRTSRGALASAEDRLDDPTNWSAFSRDGDLIGRVCDLDFDGQEGTVRSLEISRGFVGDLSKGPVTVRAGEVERIDADGVVVRLAPHAGGATMDSVAETLGRQAGRAAARARLGISRLLRKGLRRLR